MPWERLDRHGFFQGLWLTMKAAMFSAPRFFAAMPVNQGISRPLAFFILVSMFQALVQYFWQMLGLTALMQIGGGDMMPDPAMTTGMGAGLMGLGSAMMLLFYPFLLALNLFVTAGIMHVSLLLFQAATRGFEATLRAVAYGFAPIVLAAVPLPVLAPIVAMVWSLAVIIIGCRYVHHTTYVRVGLALMAQLLFFLLTVSLLAFFLTQSGVLPQMGSQ